MHPDFFARDGFVVLQPLLGAVECDRLVAQLGPAATSSGGSRVLLDERWCAALAERLRDHRALRSLLPGSYVAVQCTYFEKTAARNWLVPVHQDLSIAVAERIDHPALRGWSEKEGGLFVQPPVSVLEQLIAVRLHLDPCTELDGPLRVIPGSHRFGRIEPGRAQAMRQSGKEAACIAEQGSALVMRPLLLHASSKATGQSRRRVLHFLFGPRQLPYGLRWRQTV